METLLSALLALAAEAGLLGAARWHPQRARWRTTTRYLYGPGVVLVCFNTFVFIVPPLSKGELLLWQGIFWGVALGSAYVAEQWDERARQDREHAAELAYAQHKEAQRQRREQAGPLALEEVDGVEAS